MTQEDAANVEYNFDDKFEEHLRTIFYLKTTPENKKADFSKLEYFGVVSVKDVLKPERKLWCMYYCIQPDINKTVDAIREKYGKKNTYEILRKPIFSGAALRAAVKQHFLDLKWFAKGNLLEAPPKSHFNDERVIKSVTDVYNFERQKLHNYIAMKLHWRDTWRY